MCWCPAVALAWSRWSGVGHPLVPGEGDRDVWLRRTAVFIHQVAYLHSTLLGRAVLESTEAAGRICRACARRCEARHFGAADDASSEGSDSESDAGEALDGTWAPAVEGDCPACLPGRRHPAAAVGPARDFHLPRGGGLLRRWPTAHGAYDDGERVAHLTANRSVAGWLCPGPGWWPRPRRVPALEANCRWVVRWCNHCQHHSASLNATTRIAHGTELTVPWNPSLSFEDAEWPWELTFGGGARTVRGHVTAGAGATLWRHEAGGGHPHLVAEAWAALPAGGGAQLAEAVGCRLALGLLRRVRCAIAAVRIVGDNLAVLRYGAGTARMRRPALQAQLEAAIASALERGWRLCWQAVRRRLNQAADARATQALDWAADLAASGQWGMQATDRWL